MKKVIFLVFILLFILGCGGEKTTIEDVSTNPVPEQEVQKEANVEEPTKVEPIVEEKPIEEIPNPPIEEPIVEDKPGVIEPIIEEPKVENPPIIEEVKLNCPGGSYVEGETKIKITGNPFKLSYPLSIEMNGLDGEITFPRESPYILR